MKFILTFDDELPSSGNSSKKLDQKWKIRKQFHPQLLELAQSHPALSLAMRKSKIPAKGVFTVTYPHHRDAETLPNIGASKETHDSPKIDLFEPITVGPLRFLPIVRESMALTCGLEILFLRKEEPGQLILQGGDLDNRLKTLFDALRVPTKDEVRDDPTVDDPLYCLLESDALITGLKIETGRLLSRPNSSVHEVRLVIAVDVRVTQARSYNMSFLGD